MDGKRLLMLAVFGIVGILILEGLMAHARGTVVARVEGDRRAWQQTADACLVILRATGQPPRAWEEFPAPGPEAQPWLQVRKRVRLDFRYSLADLRASSEVREAWITLIKDDHIDLTPERARLAADLAQLPARP